MNTTLFIALRYVRNKSKQNVINIINAMAIFVLIVGGASLMIVLSGFAGLKDMGLSFSTFFDPDIKITPSTGKFLSLTDDNLQKIKNINGVQAITKVIEEKVFLDYEGKNTVAYIKGVDSLYNTVTQIDSTLVVSPSNFTLNSTLVVVGDGIATVLNIPIYTGQTPLKIIAPTPGKGSITASATPYKQELVAVSDYYRVSEDLDSKYVFSTLELAQNLLSLSPSHFYALEVKLKKDADIKQVKALLSSLFPNLVVKERHELNEDLHKMYKTENIVTFLVFTFVLLIAMFNLVGSIIMIIIDKKADIKTLYSLGLDIPKIRKIFFMEGFLVSLFGAFIGVILGVLISYIQMKYPLLYISTDSYMPLAYPMKITFENMIIVFFTVLVMGTVFSYLGSNRVTQKLIKE